MQSGNTYKFLLQRAFLTEGLPASLKANDKHLQIFDNYIEQTRIRLRKIRVPETKTWTHILEQIYFADETDLSEIKYSQMFLTETEYKILEFFKGREIRKNRYFTEAAGKEFEIDVFLGELRGLNIAKVQFAAEEELKHFRPPDWAIIEITQDKFFTGEKLVGKTFADVRRRLTERKKNG